MNQITWHFIPHAWYSVYITGANKYLDGMASKYFRPKGDRLFKFHCINKPPMKLKRCFWGKFEHDFRGDLNYTCPYRSVMTGLYSMYNDFDRVWQFRCCKVRNFALFQPSKRLSKKAFIIVPSWYLSTLLSYFHHNY